MTPDDRRRAILARIAAQLQLRKTDQALKQYVMAIDGRISQGTIRRILSGKDHRVSNLVALADSMNCDVVIEIKPRVA